MTSSPDERHLVLYHKNCLDGKSAAAIAKQKLPKGTEFLPFNYGDPVSPELCSEIDHVWFLDIAPTVAEMKGLYGHVKSIHILDHHKTAAQWYADAGFDPVMGFTEKDTRIDLLFRQERSGAGIAWDYFFPIDSVRDGTPEYIAMVEDRDLWRNAIQDSRRYCEYLFLFMDTDLDRFFNKLMAIPDDRALDMVNVLCMKRDSDIRFILANNLFLRKVTYQKDGETLEADIPFINCLYGLVSELSNSIKDKYPFVVCYTHERNGTRVSLRSDRTIDVSAIAERMGGGGHQGAAGVYLDWFSDPDELAGGVSGGFQRTIL